MKSLYLAVPRTQRSASSMIVAATNWFVANQHITTAFFVAQSPRNWAGCMAGRAVVSFEEENFGQARLA
jgi:hypothetical protein